MANKLVVLGIPWDVDTDGLRRYMSKFGDIEDCIVMKERSSGRSRGFGYVTFSSAEDTKNVLQSEHILGDRTLEVKIATPKEEMRQQSSKKATRIFVAKIPPTITEDSFRRYFEAYGEITDLYMPKNQVTQGHRGIGFITFESAESVDNIMAETHELDGSTVVVDRATPKDEEPKFQSRAPQSGGYGAYNSYISTATRYGALGAPTLYDLPPQAYERLGGYYGPPRVVSKKIFVGRLPQEATVGDLRQYFGKFGRIQDVYIPKDPKRTGHRGFGFVTFADEVGVERVNRRPHHEILGQEIAIDSATPEDDGPSSAYMAPPIMPPYGAYNGGGAMHNYGRFYGNYDFDDYGYGAGGSRSTRPSRMDWRYRPY